MSRYTFLLLAFFLSFNVYADGLGISQSFANINPSPSMNSRKPSAAIKETAPRNVKELERIQKSTDADNNQTSDVPNLSTKKDKTALSNVSCKTYEGKIYNKGEPGYNDCIRTINTDRQDETIAP